MTAKTICGLGERMKRYEECSRVILPQRLPVIIRVDGKAFHTYTRRCDKPFDHNLASAMSQTAVRLCEEIQGAQLAYAQSDEISVLVHGYKRLNSDAWFGNQLQKMVSVAAGIASASFTLAAQKVWSDTAPVVFDARAFVLPEEEVCNYFIWRQQDATRNSLQMLAQSLYSHTKLHGKNSAALQELCYQKDKNWNDIETRWKRGTCVLKGADGRWTVDAEIPVFAQDRSYVERFLATEAR